MTNKAVTRVPAMGQAWSGDWQARVADRLHARGFGSVAAFAESSPRSSLIELASELSTDHDAGIDRADIAANQLARIWRAEAASLGPEAVERMARLVLAGELSSGIPEGWCREWPDTEDLKGVTARLLRATSAWTDNLGSDHAEASDRVFEAMLEEGRQGRIPAGWLPTSADDPILVDLFARFWRGGP